MKIIICDDDVLFGKHLEKITKAYLKASNYAEYQLLRYSSVDDLLSHNIENTDILLLDVQFPNNNGIDVAALLREKSNNFILIFISSFIDYAPAGYTVNASRYILKEHVDLFLNESLDKAIQDLKLTNNTVKIRFARTPEPTSINTENILFVESKLHYTYFHFFEGKESPHVYSKLDKIQSLLPTDSFIRIHQSFLVNAKYLMEVHNYEARLISGITLPISQKYRKQARKQLFEYKGKF